MGGNISPHPTLNSPFWLQESFFGITVATPRQTASAGGLHEVRGRCILNHRWADRAPSALAGNRSHRGAPDQRPQPKSDMQNRLVPKRWITHFISLHWFDSTDQWKRGLIPSPRLPRCKLYRSATHTVQYVTAAGKAAGAANFFFGVSFNNNNNHIQRRYSRFFTISSQRRELSPTRTLKWPGRNRVQIKCNTSSAYHVQVSC